MMKLPKKEIYTKVHAFYSIYYGYPSDAVHIGRRMKMMNGILSTWRDKKEDMGALMDDLSNTVDINTNQLHDRMLFISEVKGDECVLGALEEYRIYVECPQTIKGHSWDLALYYVLTIDVMDSITTFYNPYWIMSTDDPITDDYE